MARERSTPHGRTSRRLAVGALVAGAATLLGPVAPAGAAGVDAVADCESGGNRHTAAGYGDHGAFRLSQGAGSAYDAVLVGTDGRIAVAGTVFDGAGTGTTPACGKKRGSGRHYSSRSDTGARKSRPESGGRSRSDSGTGKSRSDSGGKPRSDSDARKSRSDSDGRKVHKTKKKASSRGNPSSTGGRRPTAPASGGATYTVRPGDSLWRIAEVKHVSGGWLALYARNKRVVGDNPSLIFPGQRLRLR